MLENASATGDSQNKQVISYRTYVDPKTQERAHLIQHLQPEKAWTLGWLILTFLNSSEETFVLQGTIGSSESIQVLTQERSQYRTWALDLLRAAAVVIGKIDYMEKVDELISKERNQVGCM